MAASPTLATTCADIAETVGMSRPAGQCFAAIWRAAQAPCADDLVTALGLSRSNVSTALKELRTWGLVALARAPGDRKEYFTAPADPWEVLRVILAARQRIILAPLVDRLLVADANEGDTRAAALQDVAAQTGRWLQSLAQLDAQALARVIAAVPQGGAAKKKKKKKP